MTALRLAVALALACTVMAGDPSAAGAGARFQPIDGCEPRARTVSLNHTLADLKGARVKLAGFEGKVLVLNFWATWCAPCKVEIPHLVALQQAYADAGLQVIGIAVEEPARILEPYVAEAGINYPVLRSTGRVLDAFSRVTALPTSIVIGRDRTLCSIHVGAVTRDALEQQIRALL